MKILIFPGGGNPDSALYAKVYGLIVEQAGRFGYSRVDTSVRWPGHVLVPHDDSEKLTFQGALTTAAAKLAEYEQAAEPYDILSRSFGTYVALKATLGPLKHLRRVVLWGSPPFWHVWQLFVRDLDETKLVAEAKGLLVDERFFPSLEPVESLLQHTPRKVVVATGADDKYSTPAFHSYLMQLAGGFHCDLNFRPPVKGAPHEVTGDLPPEVVEDYLNSMLG